MSVPMSQYEALLEEVRCLRRKAQHVQQLAAPLISSSSKVHTPNVVSITQQVSHNVPLQDVNSTHPFDFTMESLGLNIHQTKTASDYDHHLGTNSNNGAEIDNNCSEDEYGRVSSTHMSVSSEPISQKTRGIANLYHGTWPVERTTMWNSEPTNLGPVSGTLTNRMDHTSVMSFASSSGGAPLDRVLSSPDHSRRSSQQLEAKMDMVYSLLAMLGGQEHADMGETLLALSTSPESCLAMRQSGCIPLLVQLVQSDKDGETRKKASLALHNLVYAQPDEKLKKRETRVLKLLEQARLYTEALRNNTEYIPEAGSTSEEGDKHPTVTVAHLMKLSFDEGHRQAICQLGGIHVIANLVETEHSIHGSTTEDPQCVLMRRYACMALTNLTFGDSGNKALLCSFREFMRALVVHLQSPSDELRQVTASVLRNLSWRADPVSKEILREVGTVTGLMKAAMMKSKENTLKSILSALWNLSAHCTENKAEICAIDGALGFLVDMLSYKAPSKSLAVIENSGGILRNISSQVAVREDYREVLRQHNCLQVLLDQLKSPSLTIVSNACGTLWNLSAKNAQDQETLWQMGAPSMLRSLNHSKHKMIAMGSSAALKNLLSSRSTHTLLPQMDSTAKAMDLPVLPTLGARKQKALLQDLDPNLHETFDNIESPTKNGGEEKFDKYIPTQEFIQKTRKKHVMRSESQECVSHTELVYESRTSRSDTSSNRNDLMRNEERLTRREELSRRKDNWKDELEVTKARLSRRDEYLEREKEMENLCQPFASLNINEPSTSATSTYQKEYSSKSRLIQNFGSSSLPYAKRPGTYIPVRNNYSDCGFEDEIESADQPIDFSRKYDEMKSDNAGKLNEEDEKAYNTSKISNQPTYGIYAETDLDQPTDYSLRYAEDDSDSEMCDKKNEFIQDTVKTYCTEGTPYETPFNFSTATSMSDLRIETNDKIIDNDKETTEKSKNEGKNPASDLDEKDHCSVEDVSENESRQKTNEKALKSQFSSGLMSPEKPVNYCDEGTPGYFSRVSSFGSLNSIPANESMKGKEGAKVNETIRCEQEIIEHKTDISPNEGAKAVKFEQTVNYAEETPLMFSRSSSLASLDSVEQHSIHDDRSSVVSDFSRLTSGLVSPSELPDSPSQTVPPSPKPRKGPLEYPSSSRVGGPLFQRTAADGRPQPAPRSIQKPSVFEDNVTKFKEESTPVQFSTATSLSSLTIDDHDEPSNAQVKTSPAINQNSESTTSTMASVGEATTKQEENTEKQDSQQEKQNNSSELNDDFVHISDNEGDDDILADCINIGMQNNRTRQNKENTPSSKVPTPTFKYTPKLQPRPQGSGIPLPRTGIPTRTSTVPSKIPEGRVQKPEIPPTDTIRTYCTEDTPAILSHAGSNSDLSAISIPNDTIVKKDYLSDDSSNLSGDNDNILAECIQSAMPKPKKPIQKPLGLRQIPTLTKNVTTSTPIKPFNRESLIGKGEPKLKAHKEEYKKSKMPVYMVPKDETEKFAIENSPSQFSLRSSLSDLTVDGSVAELKRATARQNEASGSSQQNKSISKISQHTEERSTNLSRQESLSSLSVESVGSLEAEQALLEQCISSGMPKSKIETGATDKPIGVATKQYNISKIKYDNTKRFLNETKPKFDEKLSYERGAVKEKRSPDSKNVYVASVVENTIQTEDKECPGTTATIADVVAEQGEDPDNDRSLRSQIIGTSAEVDTSQDKYLPIIETSSTDLRKNGYDDENTSKTNGTKISPTISPVLENNKQETNLLDDLSPQISDNQTNDSDSVEDLGKMINNRMLDPDAMIESLDRFTAELVSQAASHLQQKEETKFQTSVTEGGDTWNDDASPNDVTFPSISGSTPNVITFSDEVNQEPIENQDAIDGPIESDQKSNDFSSMNTSTLTESTLIAMEATKIATTFKMEADMSVSGASIELDSIQPPSQLNSLTNSANELDGKVKKSPKTIIRKKSLPHGLMVRRALSNSLNQASSLESLENHSLSNLDHMNPPSLMGDVDLLDLESSMTSVASLQSEIADLKADFLVNGVVGKEQPQQQNVNPIFTVKQPANMLHLIANNSNCSELENINPPSLFNEITDLCNSLADFPTEGICSETEVFQECVTNAEGALKTENDITHFSDANSITPIQTDVSSNESTPRKGKRTLTAKQKRTIAKERYKTYTVDADLVMKEEINGDGSLQVNSDDSTADDYKTMDCTSDTYKTADVSQSSSSSSKLTPKERRQINRSRFETQVLDHKTTNAIENVEAPTLNSPPVENSNSSPLSGSNSVSPLNSPSQSPAKSKLSIRRNFLQKRLENKDRFKTKTISESSLSPEILSASPTNMNNSTDLHLLLQKEANLILKTLSETKAKADELLDCETLSLVSNEDDSEHNSGCSINYRTYHKSWGFSSSGNNIPVIQSTECGSSENGLENYENSNFNNDQSDPLDECFVEQNGFTPPENLEETSLEQQNYLDQNSEGEPESSSDSEVKPVGKPKIVKPGGDKVKTNDLEANEEEQGKGIRGRRKPLYNKSNISKTIPKALKPIKSTTTTGIAVNNVKAGAKSVPLKATASAGTKPSVYNKPPLPKMSKPATKPIPKSIPNSLSPKHISPVRSQIKSPGTSKLKQEIPKSEGKIKSPTLESQKSDTSKPKPVLERQGTFTKEDSVSPKSKIPTSSVTAPNPTSSIPKPTRIARALPQPVPVKAKSIPVPRSATNGRTGLVKSASTDRANKTTSSRIMNRSPSADARDVTKRATLQYSTSNSNLKSGAVKRASVPEATQRSSSNSSLTSNGSGKQITSRIAGLWKKVEDGKKQTSKTERKICVQSEANSNVNNEDTTSTTRLIRSNTFENKDSVVLQNIDAAKRVSRLGSFVLVDESETRIEYECKTIINRPSGVSY